MNFDDEGADSIEVQKLRLACSEAAVSQRQLTPSGRPVTSSR